MGNSNSPLMLVASDLTGNCARLNEALALLQAQITKLVTPTVATASGAASSQSAAALTNPMTALGQMIAGGNSGLPTTVAANTSATRKFLREQGSGTIGTLPVFDTLVIGDIPSLSSLYAAAGFPATYANLIATGQTAAIGGNLRHASAVLPAGHYLLAMTSIITATGSGNLTVTVTWNDGTATETVQMGPSTMSASPGRLETVTHIVADGAHDLAYATTVSAGGGTYSLWIDVLRLL
jgi:hypothetical protein